MADNTQQQRYSGGRSNYSRHEHTVAPIQLASIKFRRPLSPELFNKTAQETAQTIAQSPKERNKATQLRRFYDELVLWEIRVNQRRDKFEEFLPFIRMINAKAAYAEGRRLVDGNFVSLVHHTLNEVNDADSLSTCKLFWEAFLGFYKQERQD